MHQLATTKNRRIINKLYSRFHVLNSRAAGKGPKIFVAKRSGDMLVSQAERVYYLSVVSGCADWHEAEQRICPATLAGQFFKN